MANKLESLFFFGRPVGPLYGVVMKIRQQLYSKQVFRQHQVTVPVISVGNLVLGGTGKTPTVIFLAEILKNLGHRPAIISRGYGGKAKGAVNVVCDGENIVMNPIDSGDEPAMIATSLKNSPVVTGKRRILPCNYAINEFDIDCIILDDGFQHMAVKRDINLVLFDAGTLAGNSRIFPGGPLREPFGALNRATAFLITGQTSSNRNRSQNFAELLKSRFKNIPVFFSCYGKTYLWQDGTKITGTEGLGPAYVFCAIANPERVIKTAAELGLNIKAHKFLMDHKHYSQKIISSLCLDAQQQGAQCLITTEKDFIKIKDCHFSLPVYVLKITQNPENDFSDFIKDKMSCLSKNSTG